MRGRALLPFELKILLVGIGICSLMFAGWAIWDFIPGTVRCDQNNFVHGTGTLQGFYKTGRLQKETYFRHGLPTHTEWYRPDGSFLISSDFNKERGGISYYLREDGTIRIKVQERYFADHEEHGPGPVYKAHGPAVYYNQDGSIDRTVEFRDGVEIK